MSSSTKTASKYEMHLQTVHIALATYPKGQTLSYKLNVEEYYRTFSSELQRYASDDESKVDIDKLYKPIAYHLFGTYDIAFVCLADTYKFAQKLFLPKKYTLKNGGSLKLDVKSIDSNGFNPNSYQIITGLCPKLGEEVLIEKFESLKSKKFIGICNLKINNTLLIGNGVNLLKPIINFINTQLKKECIDFILIQSFSWFEITLVILTDEHDKISKTITKLRDIKVSDISDITEYYLLTSLKENSLISLYSEPSNVNIENLHIFADTHSYFGLRFDYFNDPSYAAEISKLQINTETQWQIKPGHLCDVKTILSEVKNSEGEAIFEENPSFIAGKNDYVVFEKVKSAFENNLRLFKLFVSQEEDPQNGISNYVNKMTTKVLFESYENENKPNSYPYQAPLNFDLRKEILKGLIFPVSVVEEIDSCLKTLKVSRQIREKVSKIFFNYNSGIQDPVLFVFFLDFTVFIHLFITRIVNDYMLFIQYFFNIYYEEEGCEQYNKYKDELKDIKGDCANANWKSIIDTMVQPLKRGNPIFRQISSVEVLEGIYKGFIDSFQEAYYIRLMNCYIFEEMYDLDVDFNSSIQELLSTYNTLIYEMSNSVYKQYPYLSGNLIQLNLQNTVGNDYAINYSVYHLTTPELFFATIDKELINMMPKHDEKIKAIKDCIIDSLSALAEREPLLREVFEKNSPHNILDIEYLIKDYFRLHMTYCGNFALFYHWFWVFNLQNPSLYSSRGAFKEIHFKKELLRVLLVYTLRNFDEKFDTFFEKVCKDINIPIEEIASYWNRHFYSFCKLVFTIFSDKKTYNSLRKFSDYVSNCDFTATNYRNNINKIDKYTNDIKEGQLSYFTKDNDLLENLHTYMYAYLKLIYEGNTKKIRLLRRSWVNGLPLKEFIGRQDEEKFYYYVDPIGGIFFTNTAQSKKYYPLRNTVLQTLWHFSMESKKRFLVHLKPS